MTKVYSSVVHRAKATATRIYQICYLTLMTISVSVQPLPIFNEHKQVATDTRYLNALEIMSKLIWQLYNDNMISYEVANLLLDKHYNRLEHKRYK